VIALLGPTPSLELVNLVPKKCATCTDPSTCQTCKPANYLLNKACLACPKHCASCTDSTTCQSCDYGYSLDQNLCILCPVGTYLSTDQTCKKISETLQDTLTDSQLATSVATQLANMISKGSSVSLSAMVGGRIFSQIKYLNISYSGELQVALLTWLPGFISLGLTPNMPESMIEKIPDRHVPYVFEKYKVPSSFLLNFWENLGIVLFASVLWLLFKVVELNISHRENPRISSLSRKARVVVQNFLIAALYGVYGDLILFAGIEYRTLVFGWNISLLSFIISVILLVVMSCNLVYQIKIIKGYQKIKSDKSQLEQFMKNHEGSQVFFKDFQDGSLSPQLFLFFLTGRDVIFSFILATMFEYPLPQIIIMLILDCFMVVYLFLKRPFESRFDFIQQLFFEFVGLSVMISVFINAIFDAGKHQTLQARNNVGKFIIVCNLMLNFVTAIFMFIIIAQFFIEFYKQQKRKQAKKLKAFNLQSLPRLNTSQTNLKKDHIFNNEQANETSKDHLETLSLQQESFDLNLLPHQTHNDLRENTPLRPSNLAIHQNSNKASGSGQNLPQIRYQKSRPPRQRTTTSINVNSQR